MRVEALAEIELLVRLLQVPGGDVVEHAVAQNVVESVLLCNLICVPAQHDGELGLVIQAVHYVEVRVYLSAGADYPGRAL